MKHFRILSCVVVMACTILLAPSVAAHSVPGPTAGYTGDMHVHPSCGASPESVLSIYGQMICRNLFYLSVLLDAGNGDVQNPASDLPLVSKSAYFIADVIRNSSQTGILITLGSLFFLLGTVLRSNLPAAEETASSHPSTRWVNPMPLNTYIEAVDGATTAASRRHANAV
jgi:hypothetical protein